MKNLTFIVLALVFSSACSEQTADQNNFTEETSDSMSPNIEGAWEVTSWEWTDSDTTENWNPYRSIYLFTETHYSMEIARTERPSWSEIEDDEERSLEDIADAYSGLISNSGTYEIAGDSLITTAVIAKNPNYMNDYPRRARHITIEADQILLRSGNENSTTIITLKRL